MTLRPLLDRLARAMGYEPADRSAPDLRRALYDCESQLVAAQDAHGRVCLIADRLARELAAANAKLAPWAGAKDGRRPFCVCTQGVPAGLTSDEAARALQPCALHAVWLEQQTADLRTQLSASEQQLSELRHDLGDPITQDMAATIADLRAKLTTVAADRSLREAADAWADALPDSEAMYLAEMRLLRIIKERRAHDAPQPGEAGRKE